MQCVREQQQANNENELNEKKFRHNCYDKQDKSVR